MLQFTSDQFVQWLGIYFWPMLRIMALISTAPILSEKSVPKRIKIGLGMVITIIVAPSLPAVDIPIFSPNAIWMVFLHPGSAKINAIFRVLFLPA